MRTLAIPVALLVACTATAAEPDSDTVEPRPALAYWPQWRGPSGQGYVTDTKVPLEWSASKNLLWKTKLPGAGHSTPIIWGDRVFLTCANGDGTERFVVCVSAKNGDIVWQKTAYKGERDITHGTSSHAAPSCATDGRHVYAYFGSAGMYCYDLNGNPVWKHNFGVMASEAPWGVGASPVLFEDLVIQNCDNDGPNHMPKGSERKDCAPASLIALNKTTGKPVWETPRNQGRGFSTPVLIPTPNGRADLVLNGPLGVWGYDPKSGKELWHCDRHPSEDNNKFGEPLPSFTADMLFTAAGREGGALQAIKLGGSGDVSKSGLAWEVRRKGIRDVASGILVGNYLILTDGRHARISAYDIATGKQLFNEAYPGRKMGRNGIAFYASPILVNGKVVCVRQDGVTFVIAPGPELKIERENTLSDGTDFSASPAVADGKLFLRSQTHLYCIGEKAE